MRVIPVIDLLGGRAVHAVRGERARYQPVRSVLCETSNPISIAEAFGRLGLDELYIADLDAIVGNGERGESGRAGHRNLIAEIAACEGRRILLDAGVSDIAAAEEWADSGIDKIVVGSETLGAWSDLDRIIARIGAPRVVFSLDLRGGTILSRSHALRSMRPVEALGRLRAEGCAEVIILDLLRVGSEQGVDRELLAELRAALPDLDLLIGGGVSGPDDLAALEALSVSGVLVATALHNGSISADHLSRRGRYA